MWRVVGNRHGKHQHIMEPAVGRFPLGITEVPSDCPVPKQRTG